MCRSVHPGSDIKRHFSIGVVLLIGAVVLALVMLAPLRAEAENNTEFQDAHFTLPGTLIAQESTSSSETTTEDVSVDGQPRKRLMGSDFRRTASYAHLFGSLTSMYTDNVFNWEKDREDDYINILELGVWGAAPRLNERVTMTETSTLATGGLKYSRFATKYPRFYQAYTIYRLSWWQYSRHHQESSADQTLGAYIQYNGVSNLSLELWDLAHEGTDPAGIGDVKGRNNYRSNYLGTSATYDSGNRTYARADISLFSVRYNRKQSEFRDRNDTKYSGFVFYRILPKTAVFVESDYINVNYSKGFDNRQVLYYVGVNWERSGISNGSFKIGYGDKSFSDSSQKDARSMSAELLLNHRFDSKKSASMRAQYKDEESAIDTASYTRSFSTIAEYRQKLRGRISGVINLAYEDDTYFGDGQKQREDVLWRGSIEAQYTFNRWLMASLGYQRLWRDSDAKGADFTTNNYYLKVGGKL